MTSHTAAARAGARCARRPHRVWELHRGALYKVTSPDSPAPHTVEVHRDCGGAIWLRCNCEAGVFYNGRQVPCWAAAAVGGRLARDGIAEPTGTGWVDRNYDSPPPVAYDGDPFAGLDDECEMMLR